MVNVPVEIIAEPTAMIRINGEGVMVLLKWMSVCTVCMCVIWTNAEASGDLSQQVRQALNDGRVAEATNLLHQQVKNEPRDYQAWFLLGVSQSKIQRYHPAIESFRRVIELRPDLAEPHNNLAVIYNELDDIPAAIIELEASLKKQPGYLIAEENIADLYVKMALVYYKKALKKTDDLDLKMRYRRLLQVRDIGHLSGIRTAKPMVMVAETKALSMTIKKAIEFWRSAWASQNLPDYFDAYADEYIPPKNFKNQDAWEAYKMRVIGNKQFITVTLTRMNVILAKNKMHAKVTFAQAFRSNSYNSDDKKVLTLKKVDGNWKITREQTQ